METKQWWESRTIWTGILTAICGILKGFDMLPAALDATMIDEIVTIGLGIATIYFRVKAEKVVVVRPQS
jgi:hypothetical protein